VDVRECVGAMASFHRVSRKRTEVTHQQVNQRLDTRYSTSIEHRTSSIERASIISDKSRINRVMDSLEIKAGLDGKHLVEDNASLSFYWQQLVDRAEATLDSKEKKEALEVIRAMQIITSLPPEFRASRKRLTSYFTVL